MAPATAFITIDGANSKIPGAEELYSTDMKGTTDSDTLYNELTRQIGLTLRAFVSYVTSRQRWSRQS